jgi:hypothetical protein
VIFTNGDFELRARAFLDHKRKALQGFVRVQLMDRLEDEVE